MSGYVPHEHVPDVQADMCVRKCALDRLADMAAIVGNDNLGLWGVQQCKAPLYTLQELLDLSVGLGLAKLLMFVSEGGQVGRQVSNWRLMAV